MSEVRAGSSTPSATQSLGIGRATDITIVVAEESFQVHREILKMGGSYFNSMLDPNFGFKESIADKVCLEDDALVVAAVLRFLYTGNYTVPVGAFDMLSHAQVHAAAVSYQVPELKKSAEELFINAAGVVDIASDDEAEDKAFHVATCVEEVCTNSPHHHGPLRGVLVKLAAKRLTIFMNSLKFELTMEDFGEFSKDVAVAAVAIVAEHKADFGDRVMSCWSSIRDLPMPETLPVTCRACYHKLANSPLV